MRRPIAILLALSTCSCAAREGARWVPDLLLAARLARAESAGLVAGPEWGWRAEGALRWELAQAAPNEEPSALPAAPVPSSCTQSALCVWEDRERERALEEALGSFAETEEEP